MFDKNQNVRNYTGVDTNWGDRIYEGDILNSKAARYLIVKKGKEFKLKVLFTGIQDHGDYFAVSDAKKLCMLILGNKDDNPELLRAGEDL
jgi:hypothetical protein